MMDWEGCPLTGSSLTAGSVGLPKTADFYYSRQDINLLNALKNT